MLNLKIFVPLVAITYGCISSQSDELDIELPSLRTSSNWTIQSEEEIPKPESILKWQQVYKKSPNLKEVKNIEKSIKEKKPESFDELMKRARNLVSLGRYTEAELVYRECIRKNSKSFSAYLEIADLLVQKGDTALAFDYMAEAKAMLASVDEEDKTNIFQYRYTLARAFIRSGSNEDKGVTILKELISDEVSFAPAYFALARAYLDRNQIDLADFVAKRGLDIDANQADLINILGVVSFKRGDLAAARRWYNKALEVNADHVPALVNRSSLAVLNHEYVRAENDLNRAVLINSGYVEAYIVLANVLARTGRFDRARDSLSKALEIDPENAYARYNLAVLHAGHYKDQTTALRLFHEVLQLSEGQSDLATAAATQISGLKTSKLW